MSDLFHRDVPDEFIERVFTTMLEASLCPRRHTFQVLTKRPERMYRLVPKIYDAFGEQYKDGAPYIDGIWLGVSVENAQAMWRIDWLRKTPAAVRFISAEPLIGSLSGIDLAGIDQVIVGGESGPGRREMKLEWIEEVAQRCDALGVKLFVKQDSGPRPGMQGRILDALWARKEFPGQ